VNLLFVGDVMLGRLVNDSLKLASPESVWGDTLPIFRRADWRMCNLECVISDKETPGQATPKVFHFRTDTKNVHCLKAAQIDMLSLANNHVLDYDYDAFFSMLETLQAERLPHTGAGRTIEEASRVSISTVNDSKIGVMSFTDNEPEWAASVKDAGIFYVPVDLSDNRAKTLLSLVQAAKRKVDILIVSAHWGPNWGYDPPAEQIPFAHALIDAGADIIFGHSGHVCRGIEIYKNRPILYSTGDFIDDYAVDPSARNDETFLFMIECQKNHPVKIRLYPALIQHFQVQLDHSHNAKESMDSITNLCQALNTKATYNKPEKALEIIL